MAPEVATMRRYAIVLTGRIDNTTISEFLALLHKVGAKLYDYEPSSSSMLPTKIEVGEKLDENAMQVQLYAIEGVTGVGMTEITGDKHDIFLSERKCAAG